MERSVNCDIKKIPVGSGYSIHEDNFTCTFNDIKPIRIKAESFNEEDQIEPIQCVTVKQEPMLIYDDLNTDVFKRNIPSSLLSNKEITITNIAVKAEPSQDLSCPNGEFELDIGYDPLCPRSAYEQTHIGADYELSTGRLPSKYLEEPKYVDSYQDSNISKSAVDLQHGTEFKETLNSSTQNCVELERGYMFESKVAESAETTQHGVALNRKRGLAPKPHICLLCGKGFSKVHDLKRHMLIHEGIKPFKCTQCDAEFSQAGNLRRHSSKHSDEHIAPYKCTHCDKSYKQKRNLMTHLIKHNESNPLKCKICKRCFKRADKFEDHVIKHSNPKRHKCAKCNMRFSSTGLVKKHQIVHSGERPFKCKLCDKRYNQAHNLKRHEFIHTNTPKLHKCEQCDKRFSKPLDVKRHMLVHTGVKAFGCNVCEKRFVYKCDLKKHLMIHTGIMPYKCTLCDKSFIEKRRLKKHVLTHSDIEHITIKEEIFT